MTLAELAPIQTSDGELRSVSIAVSVLDCFTESGELGPTRVASGSASPGAPPAGCSRLRPPAACWSAAVAAVCVVGPTSRILGVRTDFVAASVCRAARRIGSTLTRMEERG